VVISAAVRPDRADRNRALATPNCAAFLGKPSTHLHLAYVLDRVLAGDRHIEFSSGPIE
jgi:hypothetical protein